MDDSLTHSEKQKMLNAQSVKKTYGLQQKLSPIIQVDKVNPWQLQP